MKRIITIFTIVLFVSSIASAGTADIMIIVDESGSMDTEHAWIGDMVTALDTALVAAGVTGNQYALVGFGSSDSHATDQSAHKHAVGGDTPPDWGTAAQLDTATGTLVDYGGFEDGYQAMDYGLTNYTWRAGAVSNIILITDEDRDITSGYSQSYNDMLSDLSGTLLNAVVNYGFEDGTTPTPLTALGVDSLGTAYLADGSGSFTTSPGGVATSGWGTTEADYIDLAWDTSGAAWDLNQLRAGGLTADSFTEAFVAIKVEEIIEVIPAPGAILLGSIGVGLVGWLRRRRTL